MACRGLQDAPRANDSTSDDIGSCRRRLRTLLLSRRSLWPPVPRPRAQLPMSSALRKHGRFRMGWRGSRSVNHYNPLQFPSPTQRPIVRGPRVQRSAQYSAASVFNAAPNPSRPPPRVQSKGAILLNDLGLQRSAQCCAAAVSNAALRRPRPMCN